MCYYVYYEWVTPPPLPEFQPPPQAHMHIKPVQYRIAETLLNHIHVYSNTLHLSTEREDPRVHYIADTQVCMYERDLMDVRTRLK